MHSKWFMAVLILAVLVSPSIPLISPIAAAPAAAGWQLIGQAGGPTQGIAVQGNYAYVGVGPRLVVLDISDPARPRQVGASAVFDDLVQGVAVNGAYAYVAAGTAGLYVLNIATPTAPLRVGAWNSPGFAEGVAVAGTTAYLADGPYGLRVVDVSNPAAPREIARAFDMNYAYDVTLSGRYAYIAAAGAGLLVVDISTPALPVELGAYDTPGNARGVAVSGGRAYIADERYGLQIVNVTDPLQPALLGSVQTEGWAFDVTVAGNLAYVAAAFGGLRAVNVSDPAHPVEMGGLAWPRSHAGGVVAVGSQIFLADREGGLRAVDVADAAHPSQLGFWSVMSLAYRIAVGGNHAYVATCFGGVRIYDISDPARPLEVGVYYPGVCWEYVEVVGTRLYAATMGSFPDSGIHVLDVSDPSHPVQISYYDGVVECRGIQIVGNLGYFADGDWLKIVDFSDLAHPKLVGHTDSYAGSVTVSGSLAYVTDGFLGIKIFNIADPAHITLVGSFTAPNSWSRGSVKLKGSYAFVSDVWGMRILDISDPVHPSEVSYTPTHGETEWLVMDGDRVYTAEGSYGFEVFDISDPAHPVWLSEYDTIGSLQTLLVSGGRLFAADSEGGLQIFAPGAAASAPGARRAINAARNDAQLSGQQAGERGRQTDTSASYRQLLASGSDGPEQGPAPDRPATTCVVTSTADSGPGTLRECLWNQVNGDVITFSPAVFPPSSPATIHIGPERLSWLTRGNITLDASDAGVILDGSSVLGEWDPGIGIASDGNIVRGLQIYHFPGSGIAVGGNDNIIGGSRLLGSGPTGQGNVLSANGKQGTGSGSPSQNNRITGNIIGLDAGGTVAMGNLSAGIVFWGGHGNIVGGLAPGEGNIISANHGAGISFYGYDTIGNRVLGNYLGTDITGSRALGNWLAGISMEMGTSGTLVQGNLISGNALYGLYGIGVDDLGSDYNVIIGNKIGTDATGTKAIPNNWGVYVGCPSYTRIGGAAPGEGNLISGNSGAVEVGGFVMQDTLILGNRMGTDASGQAFVSGSGGVALNRATRTIVGGATAAEGNLFSSEGNFALIVGSANNVIQGNRLGLAADGVTPLGDSGFQISVTRDGNVIQGNRIAFATSAGIWADGPQRNTIRRNSVFGNTWRGIYLSNGANNNLPAPSLSLSDTGGSGAACPGCTVELFLDTGKQGRHYLASVTADGAGAFSFPKLCPVAYPNLTATATDPAGNTSEFSEPRTIPWNCSSPNPVPALISLEPTSVKELGPTTLLSITGSGFFPGSVVRLNGTALATHFADSGHLEAIVPLGQIRITGDTSITVYNSTPGGGTSNPLIFTILPNPRVYLPVMYKAALSH